MLKQFAQNQPATATDPTDKLPTIVVLTELYFPEQTSTGYFLTETAEGLAQDYSVKVFTGPPTKSLLPCNGFPQHETRNYVEIWRCQGTVFDKNSLLGRLSNLVTRSIGIFWQALFTCRRDSIILVVTNPPLLPFVALLLKWLKGCEFVLLIHDVYPEVLVAVNLCHPSSIVVKISEIANRILYSQSRKIITLGRDMSQLVEAKLIEDKDKITYIANWADDNIIKPTDRTKNALLHRLGIAEKFVVLYAGNIGKTHGIEDLAEAAKCFRKKPNIHFIVSGFGSKKQWLEKYVSSNQLANVSILDTCPRSELVVVLNACDVAIISFIPGMAGVSVPSRMYNQMAAGKPIIAVADQWSELAKVVQEEEIGWTINPGNVSDIISTIQYAAANPKLCAQMGSRAAAVAKNKYTFTQADKAYKELFKELFSLTE